MNSTMQPGITVYRGWLDRGCYVWSPFVTKLEARLRFNGVKYSTDAGSPLSAPKGKIPYLEYREPLETTTLSDSSLIPQALVQKGVLSDWNESLSTEKSALDLSLRALLEDKLYFYHTRERWSENYYTMRDHALWSIFYPMRVIIGYFVYRSHVSMLHGQGTGRFTAQEVDKFKREIWAALDRLLADSRVNAGMEPFWILGGDSPTEADTTIFGFIVSVLICTAGPNSQTIVRQSPNVMEYADRIHRKYFPDYEQWKKD